MNSTDLLAILESLPEIQLFLDCAERLGLRFGLTGGVLRNIVLGATYGRKAFDSLYSFADPFGDIDVIALDEMRQGQLAQALFAMVPFADCHPWDFRTEAAAARSAVGHGLVAADWLILWIDGKKRDLSLGTFRSDVGAVLNRPLQPQRAVTSRFGSANAPFELLQAIKYARIQLRSLEQDAPNEGEWYSFIDGLREPLQSSGLARRPPLWRGILSRLEIEMTQLLLDAASWSGACVFLNRLGTVIPRDWLGGPGALGTILRPELERSTRIGATLYRPRPRAALRLSLVTEGYGENQPSVSHESRIPWTGLELSGISQPTCCRYADFEEGIAVIAWRDSSPEGTHRDENLEPKEYGLVAGPATPGQRALDPTDVDNLIPISGYTRKGRSIAVRIDPAYLRLVTADRQSRFLIGLVPISSSEETESGRRTEPRRLDPESERRGENEATEPKRKKRTREAPREVMPRGNA
jgi:hypothetical protein